MRQVSKGLLTVAAAGGVLAVTNGFAYADAGASGVAANSSGIASGNTFHAPVYAPVNLCGNVVNVIGALNPASGNNGEPGGPRNPGQPGQPGNPAQPGQPHKLATSRKSGIEQTQALTSPKQLAQTGAGNLGMAASASAGLLLGGILLYRRSRAGARA